MITYTGINRQPSVACSVSDLNAVHDVAVISYVALYAEMIMPALSK